MDLVAESVISQLTFLETEIAIQANQKASVLVLLVMHWQRLR